jgi:YesN/AraC family two-component response regulator
MSPDTAKDNALLEVNNRYLKRIQETKNIGELTAVLNSVVEHTAGQIFSFQGVRHASVLRRAQRYIWENYTRKISLQEIARASGLSAPYFSTVFKEEMGENLSNYLNRLRVEKAASMLIETDLSLGEISGSCGFEDQSWFSKIFKYYAGISPGKFRERGGVPKLFADSPKTSA